MATKIERPKNLQKNTMVNEEKAIEKTPIIKEAVKNSIKADGKRKTTQSERTELLKQSVRDRSEEELFAMRQKGGIESGKSKRLQKAIKNILDKKPSIKADTLVRDLGLDGIEITNADAIMYVQTQKAILEGDTRAAEFVRDTSGEKPTDKIESVSINISETRLDDFFNAFQSQEDY